MKVVVLSDDRVSGKLNSGESFSANIVRDPELPGYQRQWRQICWQADRSGKISGSIC